MLRIFEFFSKGFAKCNDDVSRWEEKTICNIGKFTYVRSLAGREIE